MVSIDTLQDLELFRDLRDGDLEKIAPLCREEMFQPNTLIFREGEEAKYLYALLQGRVAIQFQIGVIPPSHETTVHVVEPGEVFGWSALVEPGRLTASARALEPSRCLIIEGAAFKELMDRERRIGYPVMRRLSAVISRRLRDTRLKLIVEMGEAALQHRNW